jgi:hypothetical protein
MLGVEDVGRRSCYEQADDPLKDTLMDQYPIESPGPMDEQLQALGITLQPCPSWCAGDHFGPRPTILYAEDGFFHDGLALTITDDSTSLGDGGHDVGLTLGLASWVPTLASAPGPGHVRLCDGGDFVYYFTPETARQLAAKLTHLANQVDSG